MSDPCELPSNLGLDLVRATEVAALSVGRWSGLGQPVEAERAATQAMVRSLHGVQIDGTLCLGEEGRRGRETAFVTGQPVGSGSGPQVDVLADALEGGRLLGGGYPGALSAVAVAPAAPSGLLARSAIWRRSWSTRKSHPRSCPSAWMPRPRGRSLVARAKGKAVRDLVVFVLDRPRHADLVAEIRAAGAHVLLRTGGDLAGALMACLRRGSVDILMGTGGVPQGLMAACAVKGARGAMLGRLAASDPEEQAALRAGNPDARRIRTVDDLVRGTCVFFAATGISDSPLLSGVRYHGPSAESSSIILRAETGILRTIITEHWLQEEVPAEPASSDEPIPVMGLAHCPG